MRDQKTKSHFDFTESHDKISLQYLRYRPKMMTESEIGAVMTEYKQAGTNVL